MKFVRLSRSRLDFADVSHSIKIYNGDTEMQELELQFQFLFAGFPFLVPLVLVLLLTHRVVAKTFGAERLFWNESIVIQMGAFFSVGMLVGVTLFVWYLIDRPNWAATQCQDSRVTLFGLDTTNRGYELRTVGTYLLVWLLVYGLLLFVPKWIVAYGFPTDDGKRTQFLKSRKYLWPGMLGYALSIPYAMLLHAFRHYLQPDIWQLRLDNLMDEQFEGNPILAKWIEFLRRADSLSDLRVAHRCSLSRFACRSADCGHSRGIRHRAKAFGVPCESRIRSDGIVELNAHYFRHVLRFVRLQLSEADPLDSCDRRLVAGIECLSVSRSIFAGQTQDAIHRLRCRIRQSRDARTDARPTSTDD